LVLLVFLHLLLFILLMSPPLPYFLFFLIIPPPPRSTLFPYTTLFRSKAAPHPHDALGVAAKGPKLPVRPPLERQLARGCPAFLRSEEHTSELQSRVDLVCRLLLEKKKKNKK